MKKVMISQPMAGLTPEKIKSNRDDVIAFLTNEGYEIIDNIITEPCPEEIYNKRSDNTGVWYLGKSIEFMSEVDVVYFMSGWQEARGCKIEYQIANAYGLEIIDQDIKQA